MLSEQICTEYNQAASLYKNGWRIENKEEIIKDYGKGVFNFLKHFENYNNSMKTIEQLKDGECKVITDHGEFSGSYSKEFDCVFFAIPAHYEIFGYIQ